MTKRSKKLLLGWLISIAIGLALPVIDYQICRAEACGPGQIDDEQCGFGTVILTQCGMTAGVVVFVCATVYVLISMYRDPIPLTDAEGRPGSTFILIPQIRPS